MLMTHGHRLTSARAQRGGASFFRLPSQNLGDEKERRKAAHPMGRLELGPVCRMRYGFFRQPGERGTTGSARKSEKAI
jgi:hypothetical protein